MKSNLILPGLDIRKGIELVGGDPKFYESLLIDLESESYFKASLL